VCIDLQFFALSDFILKYDGKTSIELLLLSYSLENSGIRRKRSRCFDWARWATDAV